MKIERFAGEYRWLSNFVECLVTLDGVTYPTVEHAFQAAKTVDPDERERVRAATTPGKAKQLGRTVMMTADWNERRMAVMKFMTTRGGYGYQLALIQTGDAEIIEGNDWGDTFWGVSNGEGKNHLGRLITIIRRRISGVRAERPTCWICGEGHREHNWNNQGHAWACENCESTETYFANFDEVRREADIHCAGCKTYVRLWDPNI